MGLHFLAVWLFRGGLLGSPPQVATNGPFAQRPYNGFISAVTGSILQFLALWAFISLHFGLVGLYFLALWPCGLSFPCILAFSGSASGSPPHKSFGPKHKRSSIIPRAPADVLPPSTNNLRSYPERPLTFCLQAQTIFDHTHGARGRFCSKHRRSSIIPMVTFSWLAPARTSRAPAKASHRDFRN